MSERFRVRQEHQPQCDALAESLSAHVDHALEPTEQALVEAHLRSCPSCERTHRQLSKLSGDLRDLVALAPPEHVFDRIKDEIDAGNVGAQRLREQPRLLILLQTLLLRFYDRDLYQRVRAEGSCRERDEVQQGKVALFLATAFSLAPLTIAGSALLPGVLIILALVWLSTTRLESQWTGGRLAGAVLLGAAVPWICELHFGMQVPLALPATLATLATIQVLAMPKFRAEVFLVGRVSMTARSLPLLAAAAAIAQPHQLGLLAALPIATGLAGGTLAHLANRRANRAA